MKIVNHSSWRGFFAFPPNVRRHESSENCQKRCSPFPLWIYILCRMLLWKYQSQERLGAQWTKVGQYVQLGVNVFLAYHTLKFFFFVAKVKWRVTSIRKHCLTPLRPQKKTISLKIWSVFMVRKVKNTVRLMAAASGVCVYTLIWQPFKDDCVIDQRLQKDCVSLKGKRKKCLKSDSIRSGVIVVIWRCERKKEWKWSLWWGWILLRTKAQKKISEEIWHLKMKLKRATMVGGRKKKTSAGKERNYSPWMSWKSTSCLRPSRHGAKEGGRRVFLGEVLQRRSNFTLSN